MEDQVLNGSGELTISTTFNPNYYQMVALKGTAAGPLTISIVSSSSIKITSGSGSFDAGNTFHVVAYPKG
jgi:hypothetical protein